MGKGFTPVQEEWVLLHKYRERKIRSFKQLREMVERLDPDEGIRIVAAVDGFKGGGFVFVTKPSADYCVNVCDRMFDRASGVYVPAGKEEFRYCSSPDDVWKIVKDKMAKPLQAWVY